MKWCNCTTVSWIHSAASTSHYPPFSAMASMRRPEAAVADLPMHLAKEKATDDQGGLAACRRTEGPLATDGQLMQESAMGPPSLARWPSLSLP